MRLIQHKREAFWFYRFLSLGYDRWVNPLFWTPAMRALALDEMLKPIGTFPGNLKCAMNLLGRPGGYPRRPLLPLTATQEDQVHAGLQRLKVSAVMA